MHWRPWIAAAALIFSGVFNVALLVTENLEPPVKPDDPAVVKKDRIQAELVWTADLRNENLSLMGLPSDLVDRVIAKIKREKKERAVAFREVLKNQEDLAVGVFCAAADPPTRYAALSLLVVDDGNQRRPFEAMEIAEFAGQDWYAGGRVKDIYKSVELVPDGAYHPDATFMGIAAILLKEEEKVIKAEWPWGSGTLSNGWSSSGVLRDYNKLKIDDKIVGYFALMHLFAELANEDGGICRQ